MNCDRLLSKCECGSYAQPLSLGITDEKTLIVESWCIACRQTFYAVFSLADLFKKCPKPDMTAEKLDSMVGKEIDRIRDEAGKPISSYTSEDEKFLRELHIHIGGNE